MDTIFAEATPPGRGGVSIIRISGPESRRVAEALVGKLAEPRRAYLRPIMDEGEILDRALAIRFDAGASFTGEESVELQVHGAPAIVRRVEQALLARGLSRAEPGAFTLRAFLSGRMDLAEVEGLSDVLSAETEAQRRLAVRNAEGALTRKADAWREELIHIGGYFAAAIDFADEEIPESVTDGLDAAMGRIADEIGAELSGYPAAERLRKGFTVAIVGAPNIGKSTLLNHIAGRQAALVTEIAGTTRDVIEVEMDLNGLPVTLLDTAGVREASDRVEALGVERALARASDADLRIFLGDPPDEVRHLVGPEDILVAGKADLSGAGVSGKTGAGVDALLETLTERLSERVSVAGLVAHERQAAELAQARAALLSACGAPVDMAAEGVREAVASLDRLVGKIDAEDYLAVVFSSFCVGK